MRLGPYGLWVRRPAAPIWNANPSSVGATFFACALVSLVLALPPVVGVTGVPVAIGIAAPLTFGVYSVLATLWLAPRVPRSPWCFHALIVSQIVVGLSVTVALPASTGDPTSPLLALGVVYAAFLGADYDLEPSLAILAMLVLSPLVASAFFLSDGLAWDRALGGPLFFSALAFVAYHFGATRATRVRGAFEERAALRGELDVLRAERDRQQLARDLHDSVGSSLSIAAVYADMLARRTPCADPSVRRLSEALADATREGLTELRRTMDDLAPRERRAGAFGEALRASGARLAAASTVALDQRFAGDAEVELDPALMLALSRVYREALTNVVRHSEAAHASVSLVVESDRVRLVVEDDGRGVDGGRDPASGGRGLCSMRERACELGGALRLESPASGGTRVTFEAPRIVNAPTVTSRPSSSPATA